MDISFLESWPTWTRQLVIGLALLPFLFIFKRFGKKSVSQMTAAELILATLYGITISFLLLFPAIPVLPTFVILCVLAVIQFSISKVQENHSSPRDFVKADSSFVYLEGEVNELLMKRAKLTKGDLNRAIQAEGLDSLEQVYAIMLMNNGSLAVVRKSPKPAGGENRNI